MSLQGHCLEFLKFSGDLWRSPVTGDKALFSISKRLRRRILETRNWSASPQSLKISKSFWNSHPAMWRTRRWLATASTDFQRTNCTWPTWLLSKRRWLAPWTKGRAVNIAHLNLSKAFSTVSHIILIVSLVRCRLASWVTEWVGKLAGLAGLKDCHQQYKVHLVASG